MVEMDARFSTLKGHYNGDTQTLSMKFVPQSTCLLTNYILGSFQAEQAMEEKKSCCTSSWSPRETLKKWVHDFFQDAKRLSQSQE